VSVAPGKGKGTWSATRALAAGSVLVLGGCDLAYPEVVIANRTADEIELRDLSFNGCVWDTVIAFGKTTSVSRCPPGEDRVHFKKLDAAAYCRQQAEDGTIDGLCACDGGAPDAGSRQGLTNTVPTWFNYQTISTQTAGSGEFRVFEINLDDIEQDFSVPGPYGH
jgi:hypothetical protein